MPEYNHLEVYRVGLAQQSSSHRRGPSVDVSTFAVPGGSEDDSPDASSISSYAGSAQSTQGQDFGVEQYFSDLLTSAFDGSELDHVIAIQAQTSGLVNGKSREVQQLALEATQRLAELKLTFSKGIKTAKAVEKDLDWISKRVRLVEPNISINM